jgi:hypothetical protein
VKQGPIRRDPKKPRQVKVLAARPGLFQRFTKNACRRGPLGPAGDHRTKTPAGEVAAGALIRRRVSPNWTHASRRLRHRRAARTKAAKSCHGRSSQKRRARTPRGKCRAAVGIAPAVTSTVICLLHRLMLVRPRSTAARFQARGLVGTWGARSAQTIGPLKCSASDKTRSANLNASARVGRRSDQQSRSESDPGRDTHQCWPCDRLCRLRFWGQGRGSHSQRASVRMHAPVHKNLSGRGPCLSSTDRVPSREPMATT